MKVFFTLLSAFSFLISCGSATTETLFVGPSTVPCTGVAPQDCLQIKRDSTASWENFFGKIEGFEYEPGYLYTVEVKKEKLENVPADASGLKYTLKKIIKKEKMDLVSKEPQGNYLIKIFKDQSVEARKMTMNFNIKTGQVNGKGVCNRFSGTYTTSKDKIKFSQAATTRMMCREPELEQDFFQTMNTVDHFETSGDQLKLMQGDKVILTAVLNPEEIQE